MQSGIDDNNFGEDADDVIKLLLAIRKGVVDCFSVFLCA
jgi:hypothetical protein